MKAAVSVSEMAKLVGMSRARFYDLVQQGVFLYPVYSLANRRPFYTAEMQQENLTARRTGIGCDGRFVVFYERTPAGRPSSPAPRRTPRQDRGGLVEALKGLGLSNVTASQVEEAVATTFPSGTGGVEEAVVLRTVYRHLRQRGGA